MKKLLILVLLLLTSLTVLPYQSIAAEQVNLLIHTKDANGDSKSGTENVSFDVYELTDWRVRNSRSDKEAKAFILNHYGSKEKIQQFIQAEQLSKLTQTSLKIDSTGQAQLDVNTTKNGLNAAYLIVATGETGDWQLLPFVVLLPFEDAPDAPQILLYAKYLHVPTPPPPSDPPPDPTPDPDPDPPPTVDEGGQLPDTSGDSSGRNRAQYYYDQGYGTTPGDYISYASGSLPRTGGGSSSGGDASATPSSTSRKSLPQTNELLSSYLIAGALLVLASFIGFLRAKRKREEN